MKLEDFEAGRWMERFHYKCFVPELVNHAWTWESAALTVQLEQAVRALSALDACSRFVPDINLFIRMHVVREANASSRIEGTQTEMDEAVLPVEAVAGERRDDWREVNNYVRAMDEAVAELAELPLSMRLLKTAHARLLDGVRGRHKMPGEIRTSQNWIGGASLATARFIPPAAEYLPDLLGDLEFFWHNDRIEVPNLIRAAITHYQFETIHPFLDGNGRVGRLLIPFYLISKGDLSLPCFYISDYLECHRETYYAALSDARRRGGLLAWVSFFLTAVKETGENGCRTFQKIFQFRDEMLEYCAQKGTRGGNIQRIIRYLYSHPRTTIPEIANGVGLDYRTANRCVNDMAADGVLRLSAEIARSRIYNLQRYLDLFKG
ncbi:MAG: Fic family protein [bacterium]|nr:Fic family protein [bacterium]